MTLQDIFITNLKKFRKERHISQIALGRLCDSSGNYIAALESGRRNPSFQKIEEIAKALQIASTQLFMQETAEKEQNTRDLLNQLPFSAKEDIKSHLLSSINACIDESLNPKDYS
ncbi:MAG: helix-turn-helix transcriptional regulator [Treponema sp.]|jgi:transcriptional regulator with XRE-family HTH domain|nr:helix-turn-helix transcriptional regulator [Treponema sp.]